MPESLNFNQILNFKIKRGIDFHASFSVIDPITNLPVNFSGHSAFFYILDSLNDSEENAVFTASTSNNKIILSEGLIQITIPSSETKNFLWDGKSYKFIIIDNIGREMLWFSGIFQIKTTLTDVDF